MTTVTGRVRATARLRQGEVDAVCVLATSWVSDRAFPRTVGVGVPFEIETEGGEIFLVDPFDALVALPVRRREREGGIRREYAWVAPADQVTVEGEVDRASSSLAPSLHATRIALQARRLSSGQHRIPPRSLLPGEPDDGPAAPAPAEAAPSPPSNGDAPHLPRRRKKKLPDPTPPAGTAPPIQ